MRKSKAAKTIQQYYIKKKSQIQSFQSSRASSITVSINSQKYEKTQIPSIKRIQKAQSVERIHSFTPVLSKKTLEMTRNQSSRDNLKIEDRLLLEGKRRNEKVRSLVSLKKKSEQKNIEKPKKKVNEKFYDEQIKFLHDKKESIKELKDKLSKEEIAGCTFKPNLGRPSSSSRSPIEAVKSLYFWDQQKVANREKAILKNEFEMKLQMVKSKALKSSDRIFKTKQDQEMEKSKIMDVLKQNIGTYWPIRKDQQK